MKIRYIGSGTNPASYQEYPVTGVNALWQPEQISDVSDARANALVETGVFVYDDDDSVWVSQIASHAAEHDAIGGIVSATDVPAATVARRDATRINFENAALLQGKNTTWLDWSDTPNIAAPGTGGDVTQLSNAYSMFPTYDQYAMRIKHCSNSTTINGLLNYARYNFGTRTATTAVPATLGFWAYKHPGTGKANIVLRLYGGATANAADTYAAVTIDDTGPQFIVLDRSIFPSYHLLAGGIDSIRFCENPNQPLGAGDVVYIGKVFSATKGKAYLCMTFDDGKSSVYTDGPQILSPYNFKGTAYVIGSRLGDPGFMSLAQAVDLQNSYGWSVANHTWSHPGGFLNASTDQLITYLGTEGANHIYKLKNYYDGAVMPHHNLPGDRFDITSATSTWATALNSSNSTAFYQTTSNQTTPGNYGLFVRNILSDSEFDFIGRGSPSASIGATHLVNTWEPAYMFGLRKLQSSAAILEQIARNRDFMKSSGLTAWMHFAYNQGAWDQRVTAAAVSAGMRTQRGTLPRTNRLHGGFRSFGYDPSYPYGGNEPAPTNNFTSPGTPGATAALSTALPHRPGISLPGCYAVSDYADASAWGAVLDEAIANGGVVMSLQHNVFNSQKNTPGTQSYCLDQLCQAARDRQGLIEVVTIEDLDKRVLFS